MNETTYSILCWAIRLSPALFMALAYLFGYSRGWRQQNFLIVTLVVGYFTGIAAIWGYWDFAGAYAPTGAIADEMLNNDGPARVFAPFVMPFLEGIYFVTMWPLVWAITKAHPRKPAVTAQPHT